MVEPLIQRVTVADQVALHVLDWTRPDATGRAMVLVHGLASNARLWDGVAVELARLGHPVVSLDLRGHGRSDKPDDGYDLATVADDVRTALDQLALERPVVAGQSWGGNVAIALAHRHPGRVAGISCVDGGIIELADRFPDWDECAERLAPPRLEGLALTRMETFMRSAHPDWPETGIAGALANFDVLEDGTIRPWLTFERHMKILRGLWEERPSARFRELAEPVLFLPAAGTGEVAWTIDKRAAIERAEAQLARSRTVWTAGDHDLHAQFPVHVAALLHEAATDGFFA